MGEEREHNLEYWMEEAERSEEIWLDEFFADLDKLESNKKLVVHVGGE